MWIDYADGGSDGEGPGRGCEEMEAHRRTRPARPNYSLTSMGRERMLVGSSDDSEASSDEASEGAAVPATEPARIPPVESTPVVTDQAVVTAVPPATKL